MNTKKIVYNYIDIILQNKMLSEGKAWSETSREVDVGWTPGGVAPAVCACVRHNVKRGPGRVSGRTVVQLF